MNGNDLIRVISFNLKRDFGLPLNRSHKSVSYTHLTLPTKA